VTERGSLRIDDLAAILGVSPMTIHRDLDALASQQLITKVRGAAKVMQSALFETGVRVRLARQAREKEALARAVAAHLEPGQAVMLDDSTTCVYLARLLRGHTPVTVITNFVPVMRELWGKPGIHLIGLGGVYYEWAEAFMGGMTVDAIRSMRADLLVMSTSAITNLVCYHQSEDTISFKRAMLESAARKILVVDHTKFSRRALHALGPATDFDLVICDDATPLEIREQLRARGVELEIVPVLTLSSSASPAAGPVAEPTRGVARDLQLTGFESTEERTGRGNSVVEVA
jgi:DeoR/GlpR family transcriptional regulator of sugar metabolism